MVLDASKPDFHRDILTRELESVGIRLNRDPPNIYFKKKKTGGISFNSVVPLTHLDEKMCQRILQVCSECCNQDVIGLDTVCIVAAASHSFAAGDQRVLLTGVRLQEYKCHNADILLKEDSTVDDLIDVIEVLKPVYGSLCMQLS